MMLFLIQNVIVYVFDLRVAVRKCSIAFLPAELAFDPTVIIDEIRRVVLHIPNKIRQCHRRLQTDKRMDMIGSAIYDNGFLSFIFDNSTLATRQF